MFGEVDVVLTEVSARSNCYFFFFQAEDGIRDYKVTGVQTCALPISAQRSWRRRGPRPWSPEGHSPSADRQRKRRRLLRSRTPARAGRQAHGRAGSSRSEERRVGKECRSRWSPDHLKKKKRNKR